LAPSYTLKRLTEVEDSAPKFGFAEVQEARFASEALEWLAFGPRHRGDGEIVPGWWS